MSCLPKPRGKFSAASLIIDHYDTFRIYESRKISRSDYLIYVGLPLCAGVALAAFGVEAQNAPDILAAIAILTGLIFNAVLLISDLSGRAREIQEPHQRQEVMQLAEEVRANISYAVLLGLFLSALLGGISMFTDTSKPLNSWLTALIAFLGLQLLLTVLMILKRIRALFHSFYLEQDERIP